MCSSRLSGANGQEYREKWAWWHKSVPRGKWSNSLSGKLLLRGSLEQKSGAFRENCIWLEIRTTQFLRLYRLEDCKQVERGRREQAFPEEYRWQIMFSVLGEADCTTV